MVFYSRYQIQVPNVDVLTYVFGTPATRGDDFVFLDAEKQTSGFSKAKLEDLVKRIAGGLRRTLGMRDNDVVLAYAENSIWYPAIVLAAICAGGVFTGANPAYTSMELTHHLRLSKATCIFTDPPQLKNAIRAADAVGLPRTSIIIIADRDIQATVKGFCSIQDLLDVPYSWEAISNPDVLADKVAVLAFSSGTTGNPKACMITHRNIVANAEQQLHLDEVARQRSPGLKHASAGIHCAFLPLYHVAPPVALMLTKSDLVPQCDLSSVELLLCGAAPLLPELSKKLEAVFRNSKVRSRQGWGMTEATMAVTLFAPDEFDPSHTGVGYLLPNMEMEIVRDDGQRAGYDEEGEAVVRGPNIFKGYYENPGASQEILSEDGWLKTGDIVTMHQTGLLTIVDRKKELIKVKGFQVAPSEIEGALLEHEDVRDCAVVRVIRDGQEHPRAFVVPRDNKVTVGSIMAFLDTRLSAYKRLTGGIIFVHVIPKSPSGKILRRLLQNSTKGLVHL
ncbi:hypothetical protein F66182_2368 [Fusarium sp. NRRL 66182]|nr:hypothetical protein F66182_2368 [Fusarium sp. NRRL 66182]